MRNFDYLKDIDTLQDLYGYCNAAEVNQVNNPEQSAINSRRALEWITRAIYLIKGYEIKEHASLFELVDGEPFKEFVGNNDLMKAVHYIRKVGNASAHTGKVSKKESFFALLNIYNFVGAVLLKLGALKTLAKFDKSLIPDQAPIHVQPKPVTQPNETFINSINPDTVPSTPIYAAPSDLSEAETRKLYIDLMLKEAGWDVLDEEDRIIPSKACIEIKVLGMPNEHGIGYVDYVLFGQDGSPLAVVEAKRTSVSPVKGKHQAELYAECLRAKYGVMPVIYYTNGFETHIIDGLGYPPRLIYGFHNEKDLIKLIAQRDRGKITDFKVKDNITDREYQKRAIKAVCEHLNDMHRKALLVMATGTGKTRVAISLVDVLMRNDWVKNVLFLADRTSLVSQAHKNFVKLLPSTTTCVLSDNKSENERDMNARIMFSTYQTMINYIDTETKDFSVGRFDLVIIDEAHRSVFGKYGAIFKYFDSFLVGLTATPREEVEKSTYELLELEDGIPNFDYPLQEAVDDKYLVPFMGFKKGSMILKDGIKYSDLSDDEKEQFEKVWEYEKAKKALSGKEVRDIGKDEIFTYIFNTDTIDKVLQDLMTNGQKVQGGERIGKTIIFAYNHSHAEKIVQRFNVLYPSYGSDFCVLIDNYVTYAQDLINKFEVRDNNPQIAVSVDMLDTGIDVPDVVNLVFFKIVKSKIKFWQMIGRGTRLSPDIFGQGEDKECFYIFDWCRNFEFFEMNPDGIEARNTQSLTEKLFCIRTDIAFELQHSAHQAIPYHKQLHDELKKLLFEQVQQLNDLHISVRAKWDVVSHFKKKESWVYISQIDASRLKNDISPLITKSQTDEQAKRFDVLVLNVELSQLCEDINANKSKKNIITIAQHLKEKGTIPQIVAKMPVIDEVLSQNFWENLSLEGLERIRTELRELLKFVVGEKGQTFDVDVEDIISDEGLAEGIVTTTTYKQRVIDFLAENKDLPVLQKIFNLTPLNQADIKELERILWEELGSKEDYERYTKGMICGDYVAIFIRSIIGIDRQLAIARFNELISAASLNSQQEEYLKTIINYVCENGDISRETITNVAPFDGFDWLDTFGTNTMFVAQYVDNLHSIIVA